MHGRATTLKTGGCGFEAFFSMKIEKRALRFFALPFKSKFTCIHSIWSVVSLVV